MLINVQPITKYRKSAIFLEQYGRDPHSSPGFSRRIEGAFKMAAAMSANRISTKSVSNDPQHILSEIRKFIAGSQHEGCVYNEELSRCAIFLLENVPPSREAVLEYCDHVFDEAVCLHIHKIGSEQTDTSSNKNLDRIVDDLHSVLLSFVKANSEAWAPIISAWCMNLLGTMSSKYAEKPGVPHHASLNDLLQLWMTCKASKLLIEITTECFASMVSGSTNSCVDALLEASVKHSPHFDWTVAHIGSCFPTTIINRVLICGLHDFRTLGDRVSPTPDRQAMDKLPKLGSVVSILGHLTGQHSQEVKKALVDLFEESLRNPSRLYNSGIAYLLHLASMSNILLDVISDEFVQILTPAMAVRISDKLMGMKDFTRKDKENMIEHCVHLIMRTTVGAPQLIHFLLARATCDVTDADTSHNVVQNACRAILDSLLSTLYTSTHCPGREPRKDIPLLSALEPHTTNLCRTLLDTPNHRCRWLCGLLVSLSAYCGEKTASDILSHLLVHSPQTSKLAVFARLQREVELCVPRILATTVTQLMEAVNSSSVCSRLLVRNLLHLVKLEKHAKARFRCPIIPILRGHILTIATQLAHSDLAVTLATMELLTLVGFQSNHHDSGPLLELCVKVVAYFYKCLRCTGERQKPRALYLCQRYLRLLSSVTSARGFLLRFLLEGVLDEDHAETLGADLPPKPDPGPLHASLQQRNQAIARSSLFARVPVGRCHSGSIGNGLGQVATRAPPVSKAEQSLNQRILMETIYMCSFEDVTMGGDDVTRDINRDSPMDTVDGDYGKVLSVGAARILSQLLVQVIMPDVLYNEIVWPDEDFLRVTVERDLQVKKMMETHPVLWDMVLLATSSKAGFVSCSCILRSVAAPLMIHWESSRHKLTTDSPAYLRLSQKVLQCLKEGNILPDPLCHCGELLPIVSPYEAYLIFLMIWRYLKENPVVFDAEAMPSHPPPCYDERHVGVIRNIIHSNISKMGQLYLRFFPYQRC